MKHHELKAKHVTAVSCESIVKLAQWAQMVKQFQRVSKMQNTKQVYNKIYQK